MFPPLEEELDLLPRLTQGFDSHCHLDQIMSKSNLSTSSLRDIINSGQVEEEYAVEITGVVGVFCDPDTYPTKRELVAGTRVAEPAKCDE
ncbi:hypothetical protein ACF0H5_007966 [Mactra antiquata]